MRFADLLSATRDSLADPRAGLRRIATLGLERSELWLALAAVTVIGVLLAQVMLWWLGTMAPSDAATTVLLEIGPIGSALIQFGISAVLALAIHRGGLTAGGTGTFDGALLAVVWLQFILTLLQAVQIAALMLLPPLAAVLGMVAYALFFWLLSGFIAELHGFRSRWKVFFAVLGALFGLGVALFIVLTLFGVTVPGLSDV